MGEVFEDRYDMYDNNERFHVFKTSHLDAIHDKIFSDNQLIKPRTTTIENMLLNIHEINERHTSHNSIKNRRLYHEKRDLNPTIDVINDYFKTVTSDGNEQIANIQYENECVFFYSVSSLHTLMQHLWMCYMRQIFYFYDLLKNNPKMHIIMEIIPEMPERPLDPTCDYVNRTPPNITKIKNFMRDIGLHNKIHVLSNWIRINTINMPLCFKKTHYLGFDCISDYRKYLMLSMHLLAIDIPGIANKMIEDNKHKESNNKYNKRYFILEYRTNRHVPLHVHQYILTKCEKFCQERGLHLFIWDRFMSSISIYEQMVITSNAEIAIGYGGSHWLFNFSMQKGSVLIINLASEITDSIVVNNMTTQVFGYTSIALKDYYPELDRYLVFNDAHQTHDISKYISGGYKGVVDTFFECIGTK